MSYNELMWDVKPCSLTYSLVIYIHGVEHGYSSTSLLPVNECVYVITCDQTKN